MHAEDNETTAPLANHANPRHYKTLPCEDFENWDRLQRDQIAAIESDDFEKAAKCTDGLRACVLPPFSPADWSTYVVDCENRVARLRDPLNKDSVFCELLNIYKHCRTQEEAAYYRDGAQYDGIDIVGPFQPPNRIPFDSSVTSEPRDGDFVCDTRITKQVLDKLVELWRLQDCLLFRLRVSENDLSM